MYRSFDLLRSNHSLTICLVCLQLDVCDHNYVLCVSESVAIVFHPLRDETHKATMFVEQNNFTFEQVYELWIYIMYIFLVYISGLPTAGTKSW